MRKTIICTAMLALSFTAPSVAGMMPDVTSVQKASLIELATHYYGHKYKKKKCFFKKVKKHDYYGNVIIKKVKVCH